MPVERMSVSVRISNALVSYVAYLGQFFYPAGLALFYPHRGSGLPLWKPIAALLALTAISIVALALRRRRPYVLVGWFWYLGMLVPVIGLVQVGGQGMADRYTYLPQIGLCVALAWGAAQTAASWSHRRWVCGVGSALVLAILMACAWRQTTFWRDNETLWTRSVGCNPRNGLAYGKLGEAVSARGRIDEAIADYEKAAKFSPGIVKIEYNLGNLLASKGRLDEAIKHFRVAVKLKPDYAPAQINLGNALGRMGRLDEAILHYRKAVEIRPEGAETHYSLGNALLVRGQLDEAIVHLEKAVTIKPDFAEAHYRLGNALTRRGRPDEANVHYQKALKLKPTLPPPPTSWWGR
jgi:tetratricopeptide (TPR) repeat protein